MQINRTFYTLRTVQSVEGARIVVYRFVAGNVRSDYAESGLNLRIDDSAVQQVQRRSQYGTAGFRAALVFVLKSRENRMSITAVKTSRRGQRRYIITQSPFAGQSGESMSEK